MVIRCSDIFDKEVTFSSYNIAEVSMTKEKLEELLSNHEKITIII